MGAERLQVRREPRKRRVVGDDGEVVRRHPGADLLPAPDGHHERRGGEFLLPVVAHPRTDAVGVLQPVAREAHHRGRVAHPGGNVVAVAERLRGPCLPLRPGAVEVRRVVPRAGITRRPLEAPRHEVVRLHDVARVEADAAARHEETRLGALAAEVLAVSRAVLRREVEARAVVVDRRELRGERAGLLRVGPPADALRAGVVRDAALRRAVDETVVAGVRTEDGRDEDVRVGRLFERPPVRHLHGDAPADGSVDAAHRADDGLDALLPETAVDEPHAIRRRLDAARRRIGRADLDALRDVVRARRLQVEERHPVRRWREVRAVRRDEARNRALRVLRKLNRQRAALHDRRRRRARERASAANHQQSPDHRILLSFSPNRRPVATSTTNQATFTAWMRL